MKTASVRFKRTLSVLIILIIAVSSALPSALAAPAEPQINASCAIVIDFDTGGSYYEKNADTARPTASMTKVMSAYIVFEEMAAGRLSPDTLITISKRAAEVSKDTTYSGYELFSEGDKIKADTLLKLVFTASGNASMIALAEHISGSEEAFVSRMNKTASSIGLKARYADCCGIKDDGNSVSARDMALLSQQIIKDYPRVLNYSSLKSFTFGGRTFASTNLLLVNGSLDGIDGLKTGTTSAAGCCFAATAKQSGKRMIAVVLNSQSSQTRASDCKALLEYAFACAKETKSSSGAQSESAPAPEPKRDVKTSDWAKAEVSAALDAGLVPDSLNDDLTSGISRADAARLFVGLIERVSGKSIDVFMAERGVSPDGSAFSDTSEACVLAANALGIIYGTGSGRFDPDGALTRAQAAAVINRAARVMGVETGGYTHGFSDVSGHWSDAELGWPESAGVINGVGGGRFDPDGALTAEQAVIIAHRAFVVLK
ncbi:MAG: S-layer homology domain-containing protein [Clostridia bacterium]|nr:S-layer homology domain-containing protein [Clostridia bacterium]